MARDNIRNFCIIAHIDHGKSTLSDRILELTKSVDERTMEDQILDNMDIERERGITIKARAVTMNYTAKDGKTYEFNLIDTPGHVDFAYEVSRSLAACEGAILVVDATQGVEAQTLANTYMALEHDLELVPILNKIDLPSAHPDEVAQEVEDVIGLPCLDAPRVSAKTGLNVDQVLERVVTDIPAPTGDPDAPLKALIFDSIYDSYKGVIVYIRVFEGTVKPGDTIRMMATGAEFTLVEVGHMGATNLTPCAQLQAGEVGYLTASIKTVQDTRVGDTVTLASRPTAEALPAYIAQKNVDLFVKHGIYTKEEINARAEIHIENYTTVLTIEARTMADMLRRQILPAVSAVTAELCERGWKKEQMGVSHKADDAVAREMGQLTDKLYAATEKMERDLSKIPADAKKAMAYSHDHLIPDMEKARELADRLEELTPAERWPFPVYSDLLFSV